MKICIAQTKAVRGNVQENILNHIDKIERAIAHRADLIIFPELSITGYEPELAKSLAVANTISTFSLSPEKKPFL